MDTSSKEGVTGSKDSEKATPSAKVQSEDLEVNEDGELILKDIGLTVFDVSSLAKINQSILTLDLKQNSISSFDQRVFPYLKNLRTLDLRNNCLESVPTELVRLTKLRYLRLDNNQISALPSQIGNLSALEILTISGNKLFGLPASIRGFKNLHTLVINENQIRYLPSELGSLKNLRSLYFHRNRFHAFPCSIYQLKNLKEFSLEWFRYTNPPLPRVLKGQVGEAMIESLRSLCKLLLKHKMKECCLITFLEHFSEKPVDLNRPDHRNRTPLHIAASEGDCGVIEGLVIAKSELNILDKENCTPVCLALREDKINAAKTLIYSGADINKGGGVLGSPLHMAVIKMEHGLVRDFIKLRANVNAVDGEGNTPLHLILSIFGKDPKKCRSIADSLTTAKASPNEFNKDKWAPIHLAARRGQIEGIRWIIRSLETTTQKSKRAAFDLDIRGGTHGWTPLHLAGHAGHFKIVQYLINAQANLFVRNSEGKTPRQTSRGNLALTKLFCRAEATWLQNNVVQSREVNKKVVSKNDQENISQNGQIPNLKMDSSLKKKLANEIKVSMTNRNMMNKKAQSNGDDCSPDPDSSCEDVSPEVDVHEPHHAGDGNQEEGVLVGKSINDHYSRPNKINILRVNKGIDSTYSVSGGKRHGSTYIPVPSLFSYHSVGAEEIARHDDMHRRNTISGASYTLTSEPELSISSTNTIERPMSKGRYQLADGQTKNGRGLGRVSGSKRVNFEKIKEVLLDSEKPASQKLKAIFLIKTMVANLILKQGRRSSRSEVFITSLSQFLSSLYEHGQTSPSTSSSSSSSSSLSEDSQLVRREIAYLLGQLQENISMNSLESSVKDINESSLVRIEASNAVNLLINSTSMPTTQRLRGSVKSINAGNFNSLTKSYDFSSFHQGQGTGRAAGGSRGRHSFEEWKRRADIDSLTGAPFETVSAAANAKI